MNPTDSPPTSDTPVDPRFDAIVAFTLSWETVRDRAGRVVTTRHPRDPGGATKYGIDQRSHPEVVVDHLTEDQARAIYYQRYWLASRASTLPAPVGEAVFDIGVLQGPGTAVRLLQRALEVRPDGRLGPLTRAALEAFGPLPAARSLITLAEERLSRLAQTNPRLAVFHRGWLRRMAALRQHLDLANP
jgi:lysozyme family protein